MCECANGVGVTGQKVQHFWYDTCSAPASDVCCQLDLQACSAAGVLLITAHSSLGTGSADCEAAAVAAAARAWGTIGSSWGPLAAAAALSQQPTCQGSHQQQASSSAASCNDCRGRCTAAAALVASAAEWQYAAAAAAGGDTAAHGGCTEGCW